MGIDVLLIGHITKDVLDDGRIVPGGAVTFASLALDRLGLAPSIVTSAGVEDRVTSFPNDNWCCKPSSRTTVFRNSQRNGRRVQYILDRASVILPADIPRDWWGVPVVLVCPVARETGPDIAAAFPRALTAIMLQGVLRRWNEAGLVSVREGSFAEYLTGPQVAIVSREDIGSNRTLEEELMSIPEIAVITEGRHGCWVRAGTETRHVNAFPADEVDSTGAGDVFAAAFVASLASGQDPFAAARFAGCAASLFVERHGVAGMPYLADIQSRLNSGGYDV
jgi:1D-myo-inositol 3-kinase